VTYWLKLGYFTAAQEGKADYWLGRKWVSDGPGCESPRWDKRPRPRAGDLSPPFGPRYEVGDRLVVYVTGRGVCPAILEVKSEPRWDPGWVDDNGSAGDAQDWGVVTEVEGLWSVATDVAPKLQLIGVEADSVRRKGHIELEQWQYRLAERLIAGDQAPQPPSSQEASVSVPVERQHLEGYEIAPQPRVRQATRREATLVADFRAHLEAGGDEVSRHQLRPEEAPPMYSDLFNHSRGQLIEAKAGGSRPEIRMAIGQLADYRRFIEGVKESAVLLGAKPHPDLLLLLESQGVAAIWRSGDTFLDNAGGAFI
jgi:hypothetical protein